MLTRKQHELVCFINDRLAETGVSPSFEEMKEALDLKSKSGVHRLISALEERGFIRRLANRARALEVLKMPERPGATTKRTAVALPAPTGSNVRPAPGVATLGGRPWNWSTAAAAGPGTRHRARAPPAERNDWSAARHRPRAEPPLPPPSPARCAIPHADRARPPVDRPLVAPAKAPARLMLM